MATIISNLIQTKAMRGLRNFVTEVLDCRSKQDEEGRVKAELANIRKVFHGKATSGYARKKYVAKLLYIHLLGYNYDFGFPQMSELVTSSVFSEKQIGWICLGVYLTANSELIISVVEHLRKEMSNFESDPAQCLALCAAANIGGPEIAESLTGTILNVATNAKASEEVQKKALAALVRLYRDVPGTFVYSEGLERSLIGFMRAPGFGVQLSVANLLALLMQRHSLEFKDVFTPALQALVRVFFEFSIPLDEQYGRNAVPWLATKLLRILQYKTTWKKEEKEQIARVVDVCLGKTDLLLGPKEVNSNMMLFFETVNLVIATQLTRNYLSKCATTLGTFLSAKQANVRYMALEALTRLITSCPPVIALVSKHQQTLYRALRDADVSIRRRALSLLYVMCTQDSAEEIVGEMLNYLRFADPSMREPLCLKIAVLAESFQSDLAWYIDTILTLITSAGNDCDVGVWYRVVQVISQNQQYQRYATLTSFNAMTATNAHDRLIALASQLVGEYAHLIPVPPEEVMTELLKKFGESDVTDRTKAIIVTALAKIGGRYEPGRATVLEFLETQLGALNTDIQQRAIEYHTILTQFRELIPTYFKPTPPFRERESSLVRKVLAEARKTAPVEEDEELPGEGESSEGDEAVQVAQRAGPPPQRRQAEPVQQAAAPQPEVVQRAAAAPAPAQAVLLPQAAAPAHPAQPPQAQSLIELMSTPEPQAPGGNDDLLAAMGGSVAAIQANEGAFRTFLTQNTGTIFEDAVLAIQLSIQVNGSNAMASFTVTNKSAQNVNALRIHVLPVPFFRSAARPGASQVPAGGVVLHQFAFTVLAVFVEPAQWNLAYTPGGPEVKYSGRLPLVITKFVSPFPMDQTTFFARWQQFSAPNQIARASYPLPGGDPTQQMAVLMTSVLGVPVLPLQVPAGNVCGAGVVNADGAHGILARFFADPAQRAVQIEVKGTSPPITNAVQRILTEFFGK